MNRSTYNLLRRTLVILGAAAGFATATNVIAQGTVTLSGGGGSCTYSGMSIQPNGNVSVTCSGSGGTPNPAGRAFFTLTAPSTIAANTVYNAGQFKVSRTESGGPAENVAFGYSVTGAGCTYASSGPFWLSPPGGAKPSEPLIVSTTGSGSCTVTLTVQEGHSGSNPLTLTIGTTTTPVDPGPVVNGCAAPAAGSQNRTDNIGILLRDGGGSSVDQLRMDSGTIAYYKVVAAPKPEQSVLIMFTQGQQPNSPASMLTEFSVSKCPGVIETNVPQCYYRSIAINSNALPIYTAPVAQYGWTSQAAIGDRGCYAPVGEQPYYINVRWTFATCVWGAGNCGTSMQWAPTGSNF